MRRVGTHRSHLHSPSYDRLMATPRGAACRRRTGAWRLWPIMLMVTASVAITGTAHAQDQEPVFGLRPARANPHDPDASGYFTIYLRPGEVHHDDVILLNEGQVPVDIDLYLAEATTAIGGSASFGAHGDENATTAWIELSRDGATLQPGEELTVPFTVTVPEDARPGDHLVGMVTQLATPTEDDDVEVATSSNEASFAVQVVRRIGVAVLIVVEGERTPALEVLDVELVDQGDEGARFYVTVHNAGNVMLKGQGSVSISDPLLGPLTEFPFEMDTVLADDTAGFYVTGPVVLGDGEYELDATISTAAVRGATPEDPGLVPAVTVRTENVEFTVVDGGPPEEASLTVPTTSAQLEAVGSSVAVDKGRDRTTVLVTVGGAVLLMLATLAAVAARRRRRSRVASDSPGS